MFKVLPVEGLYLLLKTCKPCVVVQVMSVWDEYPIASTVRIHNDIEGGVHPSYKDTRFGGIQKMVKDRFIVCFGGYAAMVQDEVRQRSILKVIQVCMSHCLKH